MLAWNPHPAVGAKVASSATVFAGMLALPAVAQDTYLGSREFAVSCAVCHGATGKGDGEMAKLLTVKPADPDGPRQEQRWRVSISARL